MIPPHSHSHLLRFCVIVCVAAPGRTLEGATEATVGWQRLGWSTAVDVCRGLFPNRIAVPPAPESGESAPGSANVPDGALKGSRTWPGPIGLVMTPASEAVEKFRSLGNKVGASWATGHEVSLDNSRCSWCFVLSNHTKIESRTLGRHLYECSSCLNRTVPCCGKMKGFVLPVPCESKSMARGNVDGDDWSCYECVGLLHSWDDPPIFEKEAWCSHCFNHASHKMVAKWNLGRDVYECSACMHKTLMCNQCSEAMVEGSHPSDLSRL